MAWYDFWRRRPIRDPEEEEARLAREEADWTQGIGNLFGRVGEAIGGSVIGERMLGPAQEAMRLYYEEAARPWSRGLYELGGAPFDPYEEIVQPRRPLPWMTEEEERKALLGAGGEELAFTLGRRPEEGMEWPTVGAWEMLTDPANFLLGGLGVAGKAGVVAGKLAAGVAAREAVPGLRAAGALATGGRRLAVEEAGFAKLPGEKAPPLGSYNVEPLPRPTFRAGDKVDFGEFKDVTLRKVGPQESTIHIVDYPGGPKTLTVNNGSLYPLGERPARRLKPRRQPSAEGTVLREGLPGPREAGRNLGRPGREAGAGYRGGRLGYPGGAGAAAQRLKELENVYPIASSARQAEIDQELIFIRDYFAQEPEGRYLPLPRPRTPGAQRPVQPTVGEGRVAEGRIPYEVTGRETVAYGPDPSKAYQMRYRLIEMDDLIPSHTDAFAPNPAYPPELQPRERARGTARLQVEKMARDLVPEALISDTGALDRGSPIMGFDRVVESGNGRVLALRKARESYPGQWQAYQQSLRDALPQFGFDEGALAGMRNPVLVRERVSDVDRVRFAAEANQPAVAVFNPAENAAQDARSIRLTNLFVPEEAQSLDATLRMASNKPFITGFLESLPANERGSLLDTAGDLNLLGTQRIKAAMFARTYQGEAGQRLTRIFFESREPIIRNVEDGMLASLPKMAMAEDLIRSGQRGVQLSISEDLAKSLDMLARIKQRKMTVGQYLSQRQLFERELTPFQEQLLQYFEGIARSPRQVRTFLGDYADAVIASSHPQQGAMFAGQQVTKEGLANATIRRQTEGPLFAQAAPEVPPVGAPEAPRAGLVEETLHLPEGAAVAKQAHGPIIYQDRNQGAGWYRVFRVSPSEGLPAGWKVVDARTEEIYRAWLARPASKGKTRIQAQDWQQIAHDPDAAFAKQEQELATRRASQQAYESHQARISSDLASRRFGISDEEARTLRPGQQIMVAGEDVPWTVTEVSPKGDVFARTPTDPPSQAGGFVSKQSIQKQPPIPEAVKAAPRRMTYQEFLLAVDRGEYVPEQVAGDFLQSASTGTYRKWTDNKLTFLRQKAINGEPLTGAEQEFLSAYELISPPPPAGPPPPKPPGGGPPPVAEPPPPPPPPAAPPPGAKTPEIRQAAAGEYINEETLRGARKALGQEPPPGGGGPPGKMPPSGSAGSVPPAQAGNQIVASLRPFQEVMGEVVTLQNPVARRVVEASGFNPSALADSPVEKSIIAYARQQVARDELVDVALSVIDARMERFTGRMKALGVIDANTGIVRGTDKQWMDVFSRPGDFPYLSSGTRGYIDEYLQIVTEAERMRVMAGLESRAIRGAEGWFYVPRQVKGIRGVELRRPSNPKLQRIYEEATEGFNRGVRYETTPRETLRIHLRSAYQEVINKQLAEALEPSSIVPSRLVPEPIVARLQEAIKTRRTAEATARRAIQAEAVSAGKAPMPSTFAQKVAATPKVQEARQAYELAKRAYSRAMESARKAEVAPGALFGLTDETVPIAMWRNRYFLREDADALNKGLGLIKPPTAAWPARQLEKLANSVRFLAAVGDLAAPLIQGQPFLWRHPAVWAKATLRHYQALLDPSVQTRLIRDNVKDYQWLAQHGVPIGDPEFFAALKPGGGFSPGELLEMLPKGEEARRLAQLGGRQTFGRFQASYNTFLGSARVGLLRALKPTWTGTDEELASFLRNLTGGLDSKALGVGPDRRAVEGMWLAFSPRLLRSTVALTMDAAKAVVDIPLGRATAKGTASLEAVATWAMGMGSLFVVTGLALGKSWEEISEGLNPLNGKRFLGHEINGDWIGIGGQFRAISQFLSHGIATVAKGEEGLKAFTTFDPFDNPLLAFYMSRGAPAYNIVGGVVEAATEGRWNVLPYDKIVSWPDLAKHIGTSMLPFTLQGILEGEAALASISAFMGARTSVSSTKDRFDEIAQKVSGGKALHWQDLPPAQRLELESSTEVRALLDPGETKIPMNLRRYLEPKDYERWQSAVSKTQETYAALLEIKRLGLTLGTVGDEVNKQPLTLQQRALYQELVMVGAQRPEFLPALFANGIYRNASDEVKKQLIARVMDKVREAARGIVWSQMKKAA